MALAERDDAAARIAATDKVGVVRPADRAGGGRSPML
jgi:hypothetical protein